MNWLPKYQKPWLPLLVGSALLSAPLLSAADTFSQLTRSLSKAKSDAEVIRLIRNSPVASQQSDVVSMLKEVKDGTETEADAAQYLRTYAQLGAQSEQKFAGKPMSQADAAAVKKSGLYADPGFERQRNWLADALRRLKNLKPEQEDPTARAGGSVVFGAIFVYIAWALLAAAAIGVIFLAVRHLSWKGSLKRKAKALLEDTEPDRTVDEWLKLADEEAANGRFREAVRALYLACLLRFDEFDVARFIRTETNWEHLARIQASPKLPANVDFRTATQKFDRVWYGYQVNGQEDVNTFRNWYTSLLSQLKEGRS